MESLTRIIEDYAGNDDTLYAQIEEELTAFMAMKGTSMEKLPGEYLSSESIACLTKYEEQQAEALKKAMDKNTMKRLLQW